MRKGIQEFMEDFRKDVGFFLTHLKVVKNVSVHTLRNYKIDLELFEIFCAEFLKTPLILGDVDKKLIRAYLANLHANSAKKRTVLRRLSTLRSFFKYLLKEGKISKRGVFL